MRLSRRHILLATAALPLLAAAPSFASGGGADDYVHELGTKVLKLTAGGHRGDKALQQRFGNLLNQYVNLPQLASFALGTNRASMPAGDKGMFNGLLSNYAAALFVWYVADFQGSVRVLPQHDAGHIAFHVANLDGFETVSVVFPAFEVGNARLDELARWINGEPHAFLRDGQHVRRVPA